MHRFVGIIVKESLEFCTKLVLTTLSAKEFVIWGKDLGKKLLHPLFMPLYELGYGNESTHVVCCGVPLFLVHPRGKYYCSMVSTVSIVIVNSFKILLCSTN